jgi:hypothetical protein
MPAAMLSQKVLDEERDVVPTFTQRRKPNLNNA